MSQKRSAAGGEACGRGNRQEAIRRRRRSLRAGKQTESAPIANIEMQWYNRVKWGEYEHINTVLEKGQTYAKDYRV